MTVAFAVWDNRISPVFDTAGTLLVAEIEGGQATRRRQEPIQGNLPTEKVARLKALGVEEVIDAYTRGLLPGPTFAMPGCGRRRRGRFGRGRGRGGGGRGRAAGRPWPG